MTACVPVAEGIELAPPVYLLDSGAADRVKLRLADDRSAQVLFQAQGRFTLRVTGHPARHSDQGWPLSLSMAVIEGVAEQSRDNRTGVPRPFTAPTEPRLSRLLGAVVASYRDVLETLDAGSWRNDIAMLDARVRDVHPDLAGNYRFSELFSRSLVWMDEEGRLALDRDRAEAHQLDVEARYVPAGDGYVLRYRFRFPDMLVSGDYHSRFLQAVRRREHAKDFLDRANAKGGAGWTEAQFQAFVDHPHQERFACFIRTARRTRWREKDRDLVLLRGPLAGRDTGLLFEAELDVSPYPEVTVTDIEVVGLLGLRLGGGDWQWSGASRRGHRQDLPQQYASRLLRTLWAWQEGTNGGVAP